jgi:hypothetical protein
MAAVDIWSAEDWAEVTSAIPGGWLTSTGVLGEDVWHVADSATPPLPLP